MTSLPPDVEQAFGVAAGELGMWSAARLFVDEVRAAGGAPLVRALREELGTAFPVLDGVAAAALHGEGRAPVDADEVVRALSGIARLVVVGMESEQLDALVPRLPDREIALLLDETFPADAARVLANYGGRVQAVDLASFQRMAGKRSALLTFVYGSDGHVAHVLPVWLRVGGPDVRTQFRSLVGWNVVGAPMEVYPRFLVETSAADFSSMVGA